MDAQDYQAFTNTLTRRLGRDTRVLGLMAAGSMAGQSHHPDEWSDHDFWVVVEKNAVDWYVTNRDWLPDSDQIILYFREPHGGFKAVYRSAHLAEFAITGQDELLNARVNDYHLLIDRVALADRLKETRRSTEHEMQLIAADDACLFGQFLTALLVGTARYRRGEHLSARQIITVQALQPLCRLISQHVYSEQSHLLDNLDPLRRMEIVFPEISQQITEIMQLELLDAAPNLITLADRILSDKMEQYPVDAIDVIRNQIRSL